MVKIYDNEKIKFESRIINRNIAIFSYSENFTLKDERTIPSFDDSYVIGSKLLLKNGKVYVGKKVKRVRVSASIFFECINFINVDYIWVFILKNDERICTAITSGVSKYYQSSVISDFIVDVKEGDSFSILYNNSNYNTFKDPVIRSGRENTRLFIEVLE